MLIFVVALLVRSYFNVEPAQEDGYQLTGGSDPYYHKRVTDYVLDNGQHLKKDPMLNYPMGGSNNRPPVFDWSMAIVGTAFSPFNGGDVEDTTWKAFIVMPAVWGALTIFPVYFIGRAQFGKGAGLWAALLFGLMSGHISHTTMALADHDAYILFFTTVAFYFFMRALMVAEEGRWVTDWTSKESIRTGFEQYIENNRQSIGYACLGGMMIAAVALAWKGFPYLIFIIFGYTVVQLLVNMFQGKDSLAVGIVVTITMGLPLLISLPYYSSMNFVEMWWTAPFYIFLATLVAICVLVPTRDLPWTMVLTSTFMVAGISFLVLKYLFVDVGEQLFSGQGYFLRTKLFDTIAEAQPPRFPVFVFAYGIATTWLAMVGAAYMIFLIYQQRQWKADYMFVLIWAITAIYMARSAVRFIYNATPVCALLAGWIVWLMIQWADFPAWRSNLKRLSGGGYQDMRFRIKDRVHGLWKATNWYHPTVALAVGFLVLGANGLQALDAGIPFENKKDTDVWIWEHIPWEGVLKREEYNNSDRQNTTIYPDGVGDMYNLTNDDLRYLGISGPSFPSDYWIEGLNWLATQDTHLPPEKRPAFISWWDYGFWAIDIGEHPTVADNFQWGYQIAGNFITAQSEKEAIALLLYRLMEGERPTSKVDSERPFYSETRTLLEEYYGVEDVDEMEKIMAHPENYIPEKADGSKKDVDKKNAAIRAVRPILMELETEDIVDLLYEVEQTSGNSIRYFAVDRRLMPFSWDNTGILYAPVTLADYDINDFIEVQFVTDTGEVLTVEEATERADADPTFQVVDRTLIYKERFYNSMFYNAFIGWSGDDIGGTIEDGIPGLSGPLGNTNLNRMPGWNLSHFKLVKAIPGLTILKYYDGAQITGQVKTPQGAGVPNARVSLLDVNPETGTIPHGSTYTDENGYYELEAVAGNLTIMVSYGPMESDQERLYLASNNILAQESGILVTEAQACRQGRWQITHDIEVDPVALEGRVFWDLDRNGEYDEGDDEVIEGASVVLTSNFTGHRTTTESLEDGAYSLFGLAPGEYVLTAVVSDHEIELGSYLGASALKAGDSLTVNGALKSGRVTGTLEFNEVEPQEVTLSLTDHVNNEVVYTTGMTSFTFDRLLEGNYTLKVENENLASQLPANQASVFIMPGDPLHQNLTLQPGLMIRGTTRLGGTSLPNLGIEYRNLDGLKEGQLNSDERGNFAVVVPQGVFTFYSIYMENGVANSYLTKVDTSTFSGQLDMNLRQTAKLSGILYYDDNGNGIFDAELESSVGNQEVSFFNEQGALAKAAVTDGGQYEIFLPSGSYTGYVLVHRHSDLGTEPYATLMNVQATFGTREMDLGLRPAHDLFGTLVKGAGDSTEKIDGIIVATSARGTVRQPAIFGDFVFGLPSDTYTINIDIFGYEMVNKIQVDLTGHKEITVEVRPTDVTIKGKVTWKGHTVNGATVSLAPFDHPEDIMVSTTSQAGGYYSIKAPPGHYLLQVEKFEDDSRFSALTDVILPLGGGTINKDLTAELRMRVKGLVTSEGEPTSGTLIFTTAELPGETYEIETRPIEGYEIYLPKGIYYVTFDDKSGSTRLSLLQTIDVDRSMVRDYSLVKDDRWVADVVNVVDLDNLEDVVELTLRGSTGTVYVTTDIDANIRVDIPAGEYLVLVDHPGFQAYEGILTIDGTSNEDIALEPEPVALSGRLTYSLEGEKVGLENVPFTLIVEDHISDVNYTGMTNETGDYRLDEVLPGRYDFEIDHTLEDESVLYKKTQTKTLKAGEDEQTLNIEVTAKYHLHGRAFYDRNYNNQIDDGEVMSGTQMQLWNSQGISMITTIDVGSDGTYSFYRKAGDYLLICNGTTSGGATMVVSQQISLNEALEVDQLLERGVRLNATLVHENEPIMVTDVTLTGPVNLSLTPENGNIQASLPMGSYNLLVEHEDNTGYPDQFYYLDHNLTLSSIDDHQALELELEKYQAHGMQVTARSPLRISTIVGKGANFSFNVTNTGHFVDSFSLDLGDMPANWTLDLSSGESFTIDSGETITVNVTLMPDITVIPKIYIDFVANFTWSNDRNDNVEDIHKEFDLRVTPLQRPRPNFEIKELRVSGTQIEGSSIEITATIGSTIIDSGSHEIMAVFLMDGELLGEPRNILLAPNETQELYETWTAPSKGSYSISIELDPNDELVEVKEDDNKETKPITIEEKSDGGWFENPWMAIGIAGLIFAVVVVIIVLFNNVRQRSVAIGKPRKRR